MDSKDHPENFVFEGIFIVVIMGIFVYDEIQKIDFSLAFDIVAIIKVIGVIGILFFLGYLIYSFKKKIKTKQNLNKISKENNSRNETESKKESSEEIEEELDEEEIEEEPNDEEHKQIIELLNYFIEKNSDDSIPDWALNFSSLVIEEAKDEYQSFVEEKEYEDEIWQKAKNFVLEHGAYPINFNELNEEEQEMYHKAVKQLKESKLENEEEQSFEDNKLFDKQFYHANELKPEEREFLKKHDYRSKICPSRTKRGGDNFIIKNNPQKESDYHFCLKHSFAEIDKENSKVEYTIRGQRADVAFIYNNKRIAVEIEKGTNKEIQIKKKVDWLNRNFDYWIIVSSKKNLKHYKKYVDNKNTFCLRLKEASDKVQQLINQ